MKTKGQYGKVFDTSWKDQNTYKITWMNLKTILLCEKSQTQQEHNVCFYEILEYTK